MSRTLLYTVQRVLEKLNLDVVDSINDTQDAILIAREAEDTFFDLVSRNEWPERYDLLEVESYSDVNLPTALRLPKNVLRIESLRYDISDPLEVDTPKVIQNLTQVTTEEFLERTYSRNTELDNVVEANYKDIPLFLLNDHYPQYFTTFDNEILILDSWDSSVESTLQGSKTVANGSKTEIWLHEDEYVVPVNTVVYPLYLSELTAASSVYLNGTQSIEDERRRRLGISRLRRKASRVNEESLKNDYGRLGNGRS